MPEKEAVKQSADLLRKIIRSVDKKLKATRDHLLSDHVADVMGTKVAWMLKQSGGDKGESKSSFFYRRPQGRREVVW